MEIRCSTPNVYRKLQLPHEEKRACCSLPPCVLWCDTPLLLKWGETPGSAQGNPAPVSDRSRMIRKTDITESSCEHRAARNSLLIISQVFFKMTLRSLD